MPYKRDHVNDDHICSIFARGTRRVYIAISRPVRFLTDDVLRVGGVGWEEGARAFKAGK